MKECELRFNERWHKYSIYKKGSWHNPPSVSAVKGILDKPALVWWSSRITAEYCIKEIMPIVQSGDLVLQTEQDYKDLVKKAKYWHTEVSKTACDIGTETHAAIERYTLMGKMPDGLSEAAQNSFNAYLQLEKDMDIEKPIATEIPFYCEDFDFCGTIDRIGRIGGKMAVLDYKTSKAFYEPDMPLQLAAYKMGAESLVKAGKLPQETEIGTAGIFRLDKETGIPEYKDYTPWLEQSTQLFIQLRDVYDGLAAMKKISGLTYGD